jgi:phenylacetate-coenzyme A ligase PaaK-like adenylate-forming protein
MFERLKLVDRKHRRLPASYVPRAPGCMLANATNALLAEEWLAPEVIRERQFGRLRQLLCHAAEHSPFHAERMVAAGFDPSRMKSLEDMRVLPPMTRSDVQDRHDDILSRRLPVGTVFAGEISTSGSSGVPVRVRTTNVRNLVWAAASVRNHIWSGVEGSWHVAAIRGVGDPTSPATRPAGLRMPHWGGLIGQSFRTGPVSMLHSGLDADVQAAFLVKHAPQMLLCATGVLLFLSDYLLDHGIRPPGLRVLHGMGQVVTHRMREKFEAAFGVPFFDIYSCNELGTIASDCPEGHGYHVHDDVVVLEVVDDEGAACEPGRRGRLLLTGLANYGMPLIRYELGDDVIAAPSEPCPCGRGLSRIVQIVGRSFTNVLATDGRKLAVYPMIAVVSEAGCLRQYRILQHSRDHLEIWVIPDEGFDAELQASIAADLRAYLGDALRVTFSIRDAIPLAASGKHTTFVANAT